MTQYATYFSSPIQVGTAIDNLQPGIGDVVLSQNFEIANAINSTGYIVLPKGTDLLQIDLTIVNGQLPNAGAVSIFVAQLDGSGQATGPATTLSGTLFNTPVVFNGVTGNLYKTPVPYRLIFTTTTAITAATGVSQVVAEVRYAIRGA